MEGRESLRTVKSTPSLTRASVSLPSLKRSPFSTVIDDTSSEKGPPKEGIFSRNWTTESKRQLHQHRQRQWLRQKGKHKYIDFSDEERAELQRYFDALATDNKISLERLEDMLISLGLASTQREVGKIVAKIDTNGNGDLDFEEYLEIFRKRTDSEMFQVFKAMMEGKFGDRNLNFQTVISSYRRKLFVEATMTRPMRPVRPASAKQCGSHSAKILDNFSALQRARLEVAKARAEAGGPPVDEVLKAVEPTGNVPPGGLSMVWRGIADQCELVPGGRPPPTSGRPPSPSTVINSIIHKNNVPKPKKKPANNHFGHTILVRAPTVEEGKLGASKEDLTTDLR